MNYKVEKRAGGVEDWSMDKLINSIAKTGLELGKAEVVAKNVQAWIGNNIKDTVVKSTQIRDAVIGFLNSVDSTAADIYKTYKK